MLEFWSSTYVICRPIFGSYVEYSPFFEIFPPLGPECPKQPPARTRPETLGLGCFLARRSPVPDHPKGAASASGPLRRPGDSWGNVAPFGARLGPRLLPSRGSRPGDGWEVSELGRGRGVGKCKITKLKVLGPCVRPYPTLVVCQKVWENHICKVKQCFRIELCGCMPGDLVSVLAAGSNSPSTLM